MALEVGEDVPDEERLELRAFQGRIAAAIGHRVEERRRRCKQTVQDPRSDRKRSRRRPAAVPSIWRSGT